MTYQEFNNRLQHFPAFSILDIQKAFPHFDKKNLVYWQKKNYVIKIRNGWYCFSDKFFGELELYWLAHRIYSPSYISLESALSFYNFIPEGVFTFTSVSTKKTNKFVTPLGTFHYLTVKPSLFFGYHLSKTKDFVFRMAEPEKALLDYLYLHPELHKEAAIMEMRFNFWEIQETINQDKFLGYLSLFKSKALDKRIKTFLNIQYAQLT